MKDLILWIVLTIISVTVVCMFLSYMHYREDTRHAVTTIQAPKDGLLVDVGMVYTGKVYAVFVMPDGKYILINEDNLTSNLTILEYKKKD